MPKVHEVKIWPQYFDAVANGTKPFEIRKNDRDYKVGDELTLLEFRPKVGEFTGRIQRRIITYVVEASERNDDVAGRGLQPGYCVLGLGPF